MIVPSFVCGIAIARGSERAFRSFSSTDMVFFVRTLPCQIRMAALSLSVDEGQRDETYPIPQRNERGIKDPVVHAGRSCLSGPSMLVYLVGLTQSPHAATERSVSV